MSALFDRPAAWLLRTLRSLGYGIMGTAAVLIGAGLVPIAVLSAVLAMIAKPLGLVPLLVTMLLLHRMTSLANRLGRAVAAHDHEEAARLRRLIDGDGPPKNRVEKNVRILGEAEALLAMEKWPEARDRLQAIEVDALHTIAQPGVVSELGYATAHAGQPAEGVAILERAIAMAERQRRYPRAKRWYLEQRLGVALSLAGRHDEAIALLQEVTSNGGGEPRPWTEAIYFMAQSSAALGIGDARIELLSLAAREGEGPFEARARAALELATSAPHRAGGPVRVEVIDEDDRERPRSDAMRAVKR